MLRLSSRLLAIDFLDGVSLKIGPKREFITCMLLRTSYDAYYGCEATTLGHSTAAALIRNQTYERMLLFSRFSYS